MSLSAAAKAQIIEKHQRAKNDTGSTEVQVALLSKRIEELTAHLKTNPQDFATRYGLTNLVSQRRKLMLYYKRKDPKAYYALIKELEIRG